MNLDAIKQKWQSFSLNQKVLISTLGVAIIITLALLGNWLTQEEYAPLMTNLDARDASAVVEKLKELNIPYQIGAEGKSVLVPQAQVYDVRLQLASENIVQGGGLGFELFDETKLGVTDFERRLNYQRALQEEIRRTIIQLEEVEAARVHIVLPEQSVFLDDEKAASASIALKLKPLAALKPEQVKGIVYLVSSSVEGLAPESVNVIDMNGNILSDDVLMADSSNHTATSLSQQEVQRDVEKNLEKRVQTMLEKILGPGKAVAMVTAELNFDQQETTETTYGEDPKLRSQQKIEEEAISVQGEKPVGTAVNTDDPGDTYPEVNSGGTETRRTEEIINNEIDQLVSKTIKAPGTIKRLSTAVTVDGAVNNNLANQVEQLVTAAIGYSQERGDQIVVSSMAFETSHLEKADAEMAKAAELEAQQAQRDMYIKWGTIGGAILAFIIVSFIIVRLVRRKSLGSGLDKTIGEPVAIREIEDDPELFGNGGAFDNHKTVKRLADKNPEEVASLLKVWLAEDRG